MNQKSSYRRYCAQHKVPLFFQPEWLDAAGMAWDVVFAQKNGFDAWWIYHSYVKFGIRFIRNPHLTPYTGLLLPDNNTPEAVLGALITDLLQQLPTAGVLQIDLPVTVAGLQPIDGLSIRLRHTNLLDIQDANAAYAGFKPALKRQIKKAERNLVIEERDDIEQFYRLYQLSFEKQQQHPAIPFEAMAAYWTCCKTHHSGRLFFIRDDSMAVHAALWLAYDDEQAYYLAGGTDHHFYGSGAMSYLMWHAIRESISMGKKRFDFEGSMRLPVDRFFKNFSPTEVKYIHLERIRSVLYRILKKRSLF